MLRKSFVMAILCIGLVSTIAFANEGVVVKNIIIQSNGDYLDQELPLSYVEEIRVGEIFDEEALKRDAYRIFESGYFEHVGSGVRFDEEGVEVILMVAPNPVIHEVHFLGLQEITSERLLGQIQSLPGTVINPKVIERDADVVRDWFIEHGYPLGRLLEYWMDESSVLYFKVDEGVIGDIRFEGLERLSEQDLFRKVQLQPGSILREDDLRETIREIGSHPRVGKVRVKFEPQEMENVVVFEIEEQRTGQYTIGAGYNTRDGLLFLGSISDTDFIRTGRTVGAEVRVSQLNSRYNIRYIDPTLCTCWDHVQINAHHQNETIKKSGKNIRRTETELSVLVTKSLSSQLSVSTGPVYKTFSRDTFDQYRVVGLDANLRYGYQYGSWQIKNRYSAPLLGSQFNFLKALVIHNHNIRLGNGVLMLRSQAGTSFGDSLPITEQYLVGGFNTLRGYTYGLYEGDHMFSTTLEYRHRIWDLFSLAVFVDIADAWNKNENFEIHTSWGIGGRIDTPLGVLQLDLATNEDRKMRLVFGIGAEW